MRTLRVTACLTIVFAAIHSTLLDKTHMPYALNADRMAWLQSLFLQPDFAVSALPSYEPEIAANPFKAFAAIPVRSRYRFLLEEAQFTVMNFIKGPVCRGQIALDVIRDNFWVFFRKRDLCRIRRRCGGLFDRART